MIKEAHARHAGSSIHLLYVPGDKGPLRAFADDARAVALFGQATRRNDPSKKDRVPVLLTMGGGSRRMFDRSSHDIPALDDPLLEESIALAHAELARREQSTPIAVDIDSDEHAQCCVCGWVVAPEDARSTAARLGESMVAIHEMHPRHGLRSARPRSRWFDPLHLSSLWHVLSAAQRRRLLGDAVWILPDRGGSPAGLRAEPALPPLIARPADAEQARRIRNVALVCDLALAWAGMLEQQGAPMPRDAEETLHGHVADAQRLGLDADSVVIYALTAVQLRAGAVEDPAWRRVTARAAENHELLRDLLATLPPTFWGDWRNTANDGRQHP